MRKVLLIGSAGAGKSTLAAQMEPILGVPLIHLDAHFWQPGWRETPKQEWKQRVAELVQLDRWIMDGNYGGTMEQRMAAADTIILLALPRLLCLYRVIKRAIRYRGRTRPDLNEGCPEQLPDLKFLQWIWNYPKTRLPRILELLRGYEGEKQIVILRSSAEVRRFLETMKTAAIASTPETSSPRNPSLRP